MTTLDAGKQGDKQTSSALEDYFLITKLSKRWDWKDLLEIPFKFFLLSFLNGSRSLEVRLSRETDAALSPLGHTGVEGSWDVAFYTNPIFIQEDLLLWKEKRDRLSPHRTRHFPLYPHSSFNAVKAGRGWNAVITSTLGMDPFLSQGQAALKAHSLGMLTISLFAFYFISLSPTLVFSPSGV